MNMKEQVKKMALIIYGLIPNATYEQSEYVADILVNKGYGDLKEFALQLKRKIIDEGFEQLCQDCSASEQDVFGYIDDLLMEHIL